MNDDHDGDEFVCPSHRFGGNGHPGGTGDQDPDTVYGQAACRSEEDRGLPADVSVKYPEFQDLVETAGFSARRCHETHWQIRTEAGVLLVDVWPTNDRWKPVNTPGRKARRGSPEQALDWAYVNHKIAGQAQRRPLGAMKKPSRAMEQRVMYGVNRLPAPQGYANPQMRMPTDITLLDWFAGVIASGLAHEIELNLDQGSQRIAKRAYDLAEELLRERQRRTGEHKL